MRIGIDARFYGSLGKGLGRYTEKLIEHLEQIDHENTYVVFLRRENFEDYHPKSANFQKQLAHYSWYSFSEQIGFSLLLYRLKFDLVHFPHFNVPLLYRRPFLVTIHDLILLHYPTLRNTTHGMFLYWFKYLAYRMVIASAIRRASHIITVSHFTEKDILKRYPVAAGKMSVTYEAADPFCHFVSRKEGGALFSSLGLVEVSQGLTRDIIVKPYFLYVGNAYPHKNLEIFLTVAEKTPEYTYVLVGKEDYFYARLKKRVEEKRIKNIVFSGFVTDRELAVLYRFAHLYIFPSLYEGFGLPPLEALSHGLPVLSSNRGSLPEILGEAALYFDPTDVSTLLQLIRRTYMDEEMKSMLRMKGYIRCAQFHFRDMASTTHALYLQFSQK